VIWKRLSRARVLTLEEALYIKTGHKHLCLAAAEVSGRLKALLPCEIALKMRCGFNTCKGWLNDMCVKYNLGFCRVGEYGVIARIF